MQFLKTISFPLFIGLFSHIKALACGPCGCSASASYLGILPQFHRHFVGVRYGMQSQAASFGHAPERHIFIHPEIWGRFFVHPRIQLLAQMPYQAIRGLNGPDAGRWVNKGLGDLRVQVNGILLQTPDTAPTDWRHVIMAGGGLKMPTGVSNALRNGQVLPPAFQSGTGSWDALLSAIYTVRKGKWGLNLTMQSVLRQPNAQRYKASDQVQGSALFFAWFKKREWHWLPQLGWVWESLSPEKSLGSEIAYTGGHSGMAQAGCDVYWKRMVLSISALVPAVHRLNGGYLKPGVRLWSSLSYVF